MLFREYKLFVVRYPQGNHCCIHYHLHPFHFVLFKDLVTKKHQSYCPTVFLSYCHTVILSHCHTVTVILSHCHTVTLPYCHTVTLSYCHTALLSYCHTVILSHYHTVILSYCPTVTLSHCHAVTLSYCHSLSVLLSYGGWLVPKPSFQIWIERCNKWEVQIKQKKTQVVHLCKKTKAQIIVQFLLWSSLTYLHWEV